jgi:hypothetical protein
VAGHRRQLCVPRRAGASRRAGNVIAMDELGQCAEFAEPRLLRRASTEELVWLSLVSAVPGRLERPGHRFDSRSGSDIAAFDGRCSQEQRLVSWKLHCKLEITTGNYVSLWKLA